MALKTFALSANLTCKKNLDRLRPSLERVLGKRVDIRPTVDGFIVEATVVGVDAREVNRRLLSGLRLVDAAAALRSEWSAEGETQRFRNYVRIKRGAAP